MSRGRVAAMGRDDVARVAAIERLSFPVPWSEVDFRRRVEEGSGTIDLVLRLEGEVAGYACAQIAIDELQIQTFAIDPNRRRAGCGATLLDALLDRARAAGASSAVLEVRPTNEAARTLYASRGFASVGRRKAFYSDDGEDALVMRAVL